VNKHGPVHSLYLNQGQGFIDISNVTRGTASLFNINSRNVTNELTSFVVENILRLIEQNTGRGNLNLVETYRRMFVN
jgi:hypothetical protein